MKTIAAAFIKAKKEFSPALKDKTNPAFRSKYADLGACLEAVNDALLNNSIALYQETSEDETGVTVETVLLHESGEVIRSGKLHLPATKHDAQGFGSALTYARRYSLMAACGIAPEDDDGNAAVKSKSAVEKLDGPRGVAAAVLATSPALEPKRAKYLDDLASDMVREHEEGRTAESILDAINAEKITDDVEKIYLSTKMPSGLRRELQQASRNRFARA